MPIIEAIKAYPVYQKILEHFKDHHYLTRADLEQFEGEEYQAETRRGIVELEGGSSTDKPGGWDQGGQKP